MNNPAMSTKRRKCSGVSLVVESLPVDLLLEIVARADVTTLFRCAAAGRTLRRAILEPAFRRRLAASNRGFDPALLLGVSYQQHAIHTTRPSMLPTILDDNVLHAIFMPVASSDGLLVLRRLADYDKTWVRACDIFTGNVTSLPPTAFPVWLYVVLSVDGAGRSFELLVADMNERCSYQTFSSKDSQWSDIRQAKRLVPHPDRCCDSYSSAVIGRTVYWPCYVNSGRYWDKILALDVDAGEVTLMELPPGCSSRNVLPLARVHGRLCMLTEESHGIAMWTLTSSVARTWSREVLISKLEIARQVGLGANPSPTFTLEGFGERSGAVLLNLLNNVYLIRFNLGIKEETPVVTWLRKLPLKTQTLGNAVRVKGLFLHEINSISLLQAMKYF